MEARNMNFHKSRPKKPDIAVNPKEWKAWKEKRKAARREKREAELLKEMEQVKKEKEEELKIKDDETKENEANSSGGRNYTVSIALPGSILDNAQSFELRTYLAGQIARAAVVFNVDEIVIFDETGSEDQTTEGDYEGVGKKGQCNVQIARILQYLECPQYLRKAFFPTHKDLKYAGLLNPLDCPHHWRATDDAPYREGSVLDKPVRPGKGSFCDVGLRQECSLDKHLRPGLRVTVKMAQNKQSSKLRGRVVAPSVPRTESGFYWGYTVRLAPNLSGVFTGSPYENGYDVTIGTSERGESVDECTLPKFSHMLIVFGGVKGLEASLDADESLTVDDPSYLFDLYLNTCPQQGSRTIRTEEAVLITMSGLRPKIQTSQCS